MQSFVFVAGGRIFINGGEARSFRAATLGIPLVIKSFFINAAIIFY